MTYIIEIFQNLLEGTKVTLLVFSVTWIFSIPLGLILALLKRSEIKIVTYILDFYTWIIRGTPLLLQLFFVVYGFPILFGKFFLLPEIWGAIITFIINYTAYFIEIFRGGLNSIPKNQYEAASVLSLSKRQTFMYVLLPQTFKRTLPSIANETITLVKDTALISAVAISDLMRNTKDIVARDFRVEAYFVSAVIYLLLTYVLVFIFKKIEKKKAYYR
ncbi:MAG TPA: amino acid ABC transporter permease [Acholeplasmataceae bacterium]|nr:amino acid ABC transporter permease [Acholeplasmataceae bacterium]